jgi:hypothetical protein
LALALAIILFALGLVDPKYTSPVDWRFYRIKQRNLPKLKNAFAEGIKALSDQQLVTGIAVLLAGFIRINFISVYHWRIMVYLAWMSSNVHLITLIIMKEHLKDNKFMRGWRMCGMILLLGLLIAALVPMRSLHFTRGIVSLQFDSTALKVYLFQGGMTCFWNHREWQTLPLDEVVILELTFLGLNYVWRFCQIIFMEPSQILSSVLGHPAGGIVRFVSAKAKTFTPATKKRHKITYTLLLILYINCKALADIATSFAASLGVLIFSVVWGTAQLLHVRRGTAAGSSLSADLSTYEGVDLGENVWTFGQLVAVLLCILPLLAVAESFFSKYMLPPVYVTKGKLIFEKNRLQHRRSRPHTPALPQTPRCQSSSRTWRSHQCFKKQSRLRAAFPISKTASTAPSSTGSYWPPHSSRSSFRQLCSRTGAPSTKSSMRSIVALSRIARIMPRIPL